jgi:hypothetical protein
MIAAAIAQMFHINHSGVTMIKAMRLLVACLLSTSAAYAESVNPTAADGVASEWVTDGAIYVLCTNGQVFRLLRGAVDWTLDHQSPVSVDQLKSWTPHFIITESGEVWSTDFNNTWIQAPAIPCAAPVPTQGSSLGGIKGLFR